MTIDDAIQIMKTKYNYSDDFLNLLKKIAIKSIEYYGEEYNDIIINTLINTPIVMVNDKEEIQQYANKFGIKGEYNFSIAASGGYEEYFQQNNNEIERITFIMLRNQERDNNKAITLLIHEIGHAIMNYNKYRIEENTAYSKSGLIEEIITFDGDNKNTKTTNLAIEEGINEYNARQIAEMVLGEPSKSITYGTYVGYVSCLMKNEYFRKIVNDSRINGDNHWKEIIGEDLVNEFINALSTFNYYVFNTTIPREERKAKKDEALKAMEEAYNKVLELINKYEINNSHNL